MLSLVELLFSFVFVYIGNNWKYITVQRKIKIEVHLNLPLNHYPLVDFSQLDSSLPHIWGLRMTGSHIFPHAFPTNRDDFHPTCYAVWCFHFFNWQRVNLAQLDNYSFHVPVTVRPGG